MEQVWLFDLSPWISRLPIRQLRRCDPACLCWSRTCGCSITSSGHSPRPMTLRLHSDEKEFLREMEGARRPGLALLAWDGIAQSMPAFSHLRAMHPDLAVLILATTAEMADYEVFARLGASGVVLKPFVDDSLEVAIAKHLLVPRQEGGEPKEIPLE